MAQSNELEISQLKEAIANESLPDSQRKDAAALLAQLEPKPNINAKELFAEVFARITQRATEAHERENRLFKVCASCYRKQPRDHETCELCGKEPASWEPVELGNPEQCKRVAAATSFTADELNSYIANCSMDVAFAKHCAYVLELRGIPRVRSFWERAGFTFEGKERAKAE